MVQDAFFNARGAAKINGEVLRALALIHEVVHLSGKSDAFLGGSSKLNDVVIHACFSKIYLSCGQFVDKFFDSSTETTLSSVTICKKPPEKREKFEAKLPRWSNAV
jgi:hypothetical protein